MKQMAPALPIATSGPPLLRVVSPSALGQWERDTARATIAANQTPEPAMIELARYVRSQWDIMQRHRNNASGWSERLLHAQRTFNGQYDATQLAAIRQWGGSEIYARLTALKARGATALLREVYIGSG